MTPKTANMICCAWGNDPKNGKHDLLCWGQCPNNGLLLCLGLAINGSGSNLSPGPVGRRRIELLTDTLMEKKVR